MTRVRILAQRYNVVGKIEAKIEIIIQAVPSDKRRVKCEEWGKVFNVQLISKLLLMLGLESWITCVGSDHSTN